MTVGFSLSDTWALSPSLLLFAAAMAVMLYEAIVRPARKTGIAMATMGTLLGAGVLTAVLAMGADHATDIHGMVRVDRYGLFFQGVCILAGLFATAISDDYLERLGIRVGEYYALVLFGVMGMALMGQATDLMMVFVALEIMSISMYVLCALNRDRAESVEAGFKYFILGAFSSGLLLFGIALVYGATGLVTGAGSTSFEAMRAAVEGASGAASALLLVGGALLLVGFGFKVAAAPFHLWAPDVYQGAPTSVTALMASGVKAASFAAFGRVVIGVMGPGAEQWATALVWMSGLTMVVGNLGALVQDDLKRMLAYSSVAHAGYILMALCSVNAETAGTAAQSSLLFYLVAYTFMNAGAFAVVSTMTADGADATGIDRLAGLGKCHPWLAGGLTVCLLSLAGIPPTMGFVGKFYLFSAAVQSGHVGLAIVGALAAATGVYYYLRPLVVMYMHEGHPQLKLSSPVMVGLAVATVATIFFGVMPNEVLSLASASLAALGG